MESLLWAEKNRQAEAFIRGVGDDIYLLQVPLTILAIRLFSRKKKQATFMTYLNAMPLAVSMTVVCLAKITTQALVHTGFTIGRFTIVPKILPNSCNPIKHIDCWPCSRSLLSNWFKAVTGPQGWRHILSPGIGEIANWSSTLGVIGIGFGLSVYAQYKFFKDRRRSWKSLEAERRASSKYDWKMNALTTGGMGMVLENILVMVGLLKLGFDNGSSVTEMMVLCGLGAQAGGLVVDALKASGVEED